MLRTPVAIQLSLFKISTSFTTANGKRRKHVEIKEKYTKIEKGGLPASRCYSLMLVDTQTLVISWGIFLQIKLLCVNIANWKVVKRIFRVDLLNGQLSQRCAQFYLFCRPAFSVPHANFFYSAGVLKQILTQSCFVSENCDVILEVLSSFQFCISKTG